MPTAGDVGRPPRSTAGWPACTASPAIIRRVTSLLLLATGLVAFVVGWLLVERLGGRARVGRILATTPIIPVDEAVRLAAVGGRLARMT